jgi:hypothetical protein
MSAVANITSTICLFAFFGCSDSNNQIVPTNEETTSNVTISKDSVSLTTQLPPELIEGTPQPIKVPNLELAPQKAPTVLVSKDTVLLSNGMTVTASDDFPIIGELEYITDGDKDAGEGYFVELMDGLQWIQIDLQKTYVLSAIWIWHYHSQKRAYHDVIVQVSNDRNFSNEVTTLFNNDYDNTSELGKGSDYPYVESHFGKLINAEGAEARYIRLYSYGNTSNDMNHYIEVEVYGIISP